MILQQFANSLALGGVYVLVALGLFLVFNTLHIPNFAHGETFALGAFLQWWLVTQLNLPFFPAVIIVVVVVAGVGVAIYQTVFRRLIKINVKAMFMGALALAFILQEVMGLVWGKDPLGMPEPIPGVADILGIKISNYRVLIVVIALITALAVGVIVFKSKFGRQLRALAQNGEMAKLSGINVERVSVTTFALGAAVAGLAGALLAPTAPLNPHMGFHLTLISFVIVVVVGAGGRMGWVIAAGFILATLETLTVAYVDGSLRTAVAFAVLTLFLIVRPEGVARASNSLKVNL